MGTRRALVGAFVVLFASMAGLAWPHPAAAQKQPPITIVINQSPWFGGFKGLVEAYEKQTGSTVSLDVNPFAGTLEKQRSSVRAKEGQFDLLLLNPACSSPSSTPAGSWSP